MGIDKTSDISGLKSIFLEKVLPLVAKSGWDIKILEQASLEMAKPANYHKLLFPEGIYQVLDFFERSQDELMLQSLDKLELSSSIPAKIFTAIKTRISQQNLEILKHNQALYLTPRGAALASTVAWRTADCIWNYYQDSSKDYNYYTKRAILALIYMRSYSYYIKDDSIDHQNTDKFITQLLAQTNNIKYIKTQLHKLGQKLPLLRLFLQ